MQWVGYVSNVYTLPQNRKKGLATQLMELLISHSKSLGLSKLHLGTTEDGKGVYQRVGFDKVKFNDTILYIYNRNNPISDDKVNQQLQWDIHAEISNKIKFNKIESYK